MSIPARPPNTEPTWTIEVAKSNDAGKLASLQIAAFRSNELFKVQFPTDLVVEVFETFLTERIKQEIIGQHANVLILRDPRNYTSGPESIVAFAIWNPPQPEETADAKAKTSGQWPPGTNIDMLQAWGAKVSQAYKEAMSERKCYRLVWLVTDARYTGRGAGSTLLKWGLEKAKAEGVPVYLESTMESRDWYLRRGFEKVVEMGIELPGGKDGYREVGLLWEL